MRPRIVKKLLSKHQLEAKQSRAKSEDTIFFHPNKLSRAETVCKTYFNSNLHNSPEPGLTKKNCTTIDSLINIWRMLRSCLGVIDQHLLGCRSNKTQMCHRWAKEEVKVAPPSCPGK